MSSVGDLWLFVEIFLLITTLPLFIRWLSLLRLLRLLTPRRAKSPGDMLESRLPRKLVRYTDFILRRNALVYRPNCLRRSLVMYHFLRRYGFEVQVCFGVKFPEAKGEPMQRSEMNGHAWLVWRGKPVLEPSYAAIPTYTVTFSFPESKAYQRTSIAQSEH